jgi:hypothetical protein
MNTEKLESLASPWFFLGAFVLLVVGVIERLANAFGSSILQVVRAFTLLETAVVLLAFVIVIELKGIRKAVERKP